MPPDRRAQSDTEGDCSADVNRTRVPLMQPNMLVRRTTHSGVRGFCILHRIKREFDADQVADVRLRAVPDDRVPVAA